MLSSLRDAVLEPKDTKSAIKQALRSISGIGTSWVVVESEDDAALYFRFMRSESTIVKTSNDEKGRKGCSNVEIIVREIKDEEPKAHIMGIRDADYTPYVTTYIQPENIFLTDRRDLEMLLLESPSVIQKLKELTPCFDDALAKSIPICRMFGYLRICNEVEQLSVRFHEQLRPAKYWDFKTHTMKPNWEELCKDSFISLTKGNYSHSSFDSFITSHSLEKEDDYDVCRGHDVLSVLSLHLIQSCYSADHLMAKMIVSYSLDDFKSTKLYASIIDWQTREGVVVIDD